MKHTLIMLLVFVPLFVLITFLNHLKYRRWRRNRLARRNGYEGWMQRGPAAMTYGIAVVFGAALGYIFNLQHPARDLALAIPAGVVLAVVIVAAGRVQARQYNRRADQGLVPPPTTDRDEALRRADGA